MVVSYLVIGEQLAACSGLATSEERCPALENASAGRELALQLRSSPKNSPDLGIP
jgi:hypothetical protein